MFNHKIFLKVCLINYKNNTNNNIIIIVVIVIVVVGSMRLSKTKQNNKNYLKKNKTETEFLSI